MRQDVQHRRPAERRSKERGAAALAVILGVGMIAPAAPAFAAGSSGASSNGEAAKTATQILADAQAATAKASSVRVSGTLREGKSTTTLNLVDGHLQGGGTIGQDGATFNVVLHAPKVYLKGSQATWTKVDNAAIASLLANRWLQTTTKNKDFTDFVNLIDLPTIAKAITPSGSIVKGAPTTFEGQPAIPLHDQGSDQGSLYVAASGTPYVLGIVGGGSRHGALLFSEYGKARIPASPAHSLNLDKLNNNGKKKKAPTRTTDPA